MSFQEPPLLLLMVTGVMLTCPLLRSPSISAGKALGPGAPFPLPQAHWKTPVPLDRGVNASCSKDLGTKMLILSLPAPPPQLYLCSFLQCCENARKFKVAFPLPNLWVKIRQWEWKIPAAPRSIHYVVLNSKGGAHGCFLQVTQGLSRWQEGSRDRILVWRSDSF